MMIARTNFLMLVAGLFLLSACSLNSSEISIGDLPQEVAADFELRHPNSKKLKWEKEGDFWEAEFKENGVEVSTIYDADFNWVRTEREISVSDLPNVILTYVNENYAGSKIEEAESFESSEEGNGYIVEIGINKQELELFFTGEGEFLRQALEEEDGDDD